MESTFLNSSYIIGIVDDHIDCVYFDRRSVIEAVYNRLNPHREEEAVSLTPRDPRPLYPPP